MAAGSNKMEALCGGITDYPGQSQPMHPLYIT